VAALRALILAAALLCACGRVDQETVDVERAWARTSAAGQTSGAVYFELSVQEDDVLVGVAVSPSVAANAQIHNSMTIDDGTMDDGTMDDGSTMMHEASSMPLVAGIPVAFEPGGYHVMLVDLVEPLMAGDLVALELELETAGQIEVPAVVSDEAP
jgi:periplasmic copper chaperone A